MAQLIYSAQALNDLQRLVDFLAPTEPALALETVALIEEAVNLLQRHPLVGRPVEHGLRELVISRGRTGYLALYDLVPAHDAVLILSVRHQREAGYRGAEG